MRRATAFLGLAARTLTSSSSSSSSSLLRAPTHRAYSQRTAARVAGGAGTVAALALFAWGPATANAAPEKTGDRTTASTSDSSSTTGSPTDPSLPVYTRAQVAEHSSLEKRVWVTYNGSIYDVTDFVIMHPGGNKILLAAGGAVEPFWRHYAQHQKEYVTDLLEKYRIGTLDAAEAAALAASHKAAGDPYSSDPDRHPALVARSLKPYNAETPESLLTDAYLTPQELLFTRNHLPVPEVDIKSFRLEVDGLPRRAAGNAQLQTSTSPASSASASKSAASSASAHLTLADLARFHKETVVSVIQCAGNRRGAMSRARPSHGLDWGVGAIGNVEWGGVRLRDVLLSLGVRDEDVGKRFSHVQFEGLDRDPASGKGYGASVPADIAMDPSRPVLLAWEANGQPLTRDHGSPLRVIVPGVVAARQIKWLGRIALAKEESDTVWQRRDYKLFPPYVDPSNVKYEEMPSMQDMPVNSGIAEPEEGTVVPVTAGQASIQAKGWAWSGGGRGIERVDISADGGKTWAPTTLTQKPEDPSPSHTKSWGWTLWEADVPVPSSLTKLLQERKAAATAVSNRLILPPRSPAPSAQEPLRMEILVKAVDAAGNTQPESPLPIYNYRGISNNSWSRTVVELE